MKKILSIILLLTLSQGGWFKYYTSSYEELMVGEWEQRINGKYYGKVLFNADKTFYMHDMQRGKDRFKDKWRITDTKIILFDEGDNPILYDYEFHGSDKVCLYTATIIHNKEKEYVMDECLMSFNRINP